MKNKLDLNLTLKQLKLNEEHFKNWIVNSHISYYKSPYLIVNLPLKDRIPSYTNGTINTESMIGLVNINSIYNTFAEILRRYYLAEEAQKIYRKLDSNKNSIDDNSKNYWKYNMRNFYIRGVIPDLFSLIDYISFFINNLSNNSYISNPKKVDFISLKQILIKKGTKEMGYLNKDDFHLIKKIFLELGEVYNRPNKYLRNIITHRYYLSIDEQPVTGIIKNNSRYFKTENNKGQLTYDEISNLSHTLIKATHKGLKDLLNLSCFSNILMI